MRLVVVVVVMMVVIGRRQAQWRKGRRRALVKMLETPDGGRQRIHSHRWMMRDLEFIFHTTTASHFTISSASACSAHPVGVGLMRRHDRLDHRR